MGVSTQTSVAAGARTLHREPPGGRGTWKPGSVTWRRETFMDTRGVANFIMAIGIAAAAFYLW
jgi:hypothetical protein